MPAVQTLPREGMALQGGWWVLRVLCDSLSASEICLGPAMGVGRGGEQTSQNEALL